MTASDDSFDDLEQFDREYAPSKGQKPGLDALPDGDADFRITDAELTQTPKTGERILRMTLLVLTGPAAGQSVERVYFFRTQQNVDFLGGDLATLGFDADQWSAKYGKKFSQELPKVVTRLRGVCFRGHKKTTPSPDPQKPYHNLYINQRIAGDPMPPLPEEEPNEEIPY